MNMATLHRTVHHGLCAFLLLACTGLCQEQSNGLITQSPSPYIIGGSVSNVTLTCHVNTSNRSAVNYYWVYLDGPQVSPCQGNDAATNTCTYQPILTVADKTVQCQAVFDGMAVTVRFQPNILYPPQTAPVITLAPQHDGPLRQGDVLTCSVSGGKPNNQTTVNFYCFYPQLDDEDDVIGSNVSSSVIVNTSLATENNMTCICSAIWLPLPSIYDKTANMSYALEFRPEITNFTLNGSVTTDAANGSSVTLECFAKGRPAANITLYGASGNVISQRLVTSDDKADRMAVVETNHSFTLEVNAANQTGHYRCQADNGVRAAQSQHAFLGVLSSPTAADDTFKNGSIPVLGAMLSFLLVAYPTPNISIIHNSSLTSDDVTSQTGNNNYTFDATCSRVVGQEYKVNCTVRPVEIKDGYTGLFVANASNGQPPPFVFRFEIYSTVTLPPTTPTTTAQTHVAAASSLGDGAIAGIVIACFVGATFLTVLVVVYLVKRHRGVAQMRKPNEEGGRSNSVRGSYTPSTAQPPNNPKHLSSTYVNTPNGVDNKGADLPDVPNGNSLGKQPVNEGTAHSKQAPDPTPKQAAKSKEGLKHKNNNTTTSTANNGTPNSVKPEEHIYSGAWDLKTSPSIKLIDAVTARNAPTASPARPENDFGGYSTTHDVAANLKSSTSPSQLPDRDSKGYAIPDNLVHFPNHFEDEEFPPPKPKSTPPPKGTRPDHPFMGSLKSSPPAADDCRESGNGYSNVADGAVQSKAPNSTVPQTTQSSDDGYQTISETAAAKNSNKSSAGNPVASPGSGSGTPKLAHPVTEGPYAEVSLADLSPRRFVGPNGDVYSMVGEHNKNATGTNKLGVDKAGQQSNSPQGTDLYNTLGQLESTPRDPTYDHIN